MRTVISLTAGLLVSVTSLSAQQTPPIEPGSRVRVTARDLGLHKLAATLEVWSGDTLVLGLPWTLSCPLACVTSLDVSRGRQRHPLLGATIGFLSGTTLGIAAMAAICSTEMPGACLSEDGFKYAALWFGLPATALGAGIGFLIKSERCEEVPLDQLRVSIAQQRDGRFAFALQGKFWVPVLQPWRLAPLGASLSNRPQMSQFRPLMSQERTTQRWYKPA